MKVICYLVLLIAAVALLFSVAVIAGDCPSCDQGLPRLPGRASEGKPAEVNGRPQISVRIDGSWDSTPGHTDSQVWDAVNEGMRRWNDATNGFGTSSYYNFDLRQTDSGAQITIVKDAGEKACAHTDGPPGGPYVIHLPANANQRTLEALINTIEHELGHVYGLDHPDKDATCPGNQSIMKGNPGKKVNGKWDKCGGTSRSLTVNDVQMANVVTSTPSGAPAGRCGYTWQFGPKDPPGPEGPVGGYVEPNFFYYPVCYYMYYARDYYTCVTIDGQTSCRYDSTRYFLEDIICF
jgi:hypothetical protein